MLGIIFNDNGTISTIRQLAGRTKNPTGLLKVGGREVANTVRKHLLKKHQSEPNKLGGKRAQFWRKVANSVTDNKEGRPDVTLIGSTVVISINDPRFAQKLLGGVITAKRVKNLSIPLTAEAYGKTPGTFEHETGIKLTFIRRRNSKFLALLEKGGGLKMEYLLTPSVDQDPNPSALPTEQELTAAFISRAEKFVAREERDANL